MAKNIVICCDGTGNRPDADENGRPALSNVAKLFATLQDHTASGWQQVIWYDAGVGTGTSSQSRLALTLRRVGDWIGGTLPRVTALWGRLRMLLELATGAGILENITEGYAEIVRRYEPGDRIYLVGFSRGAYTARCIAGVIARCGLLRSENARYAADVVQLYRYRDVRDGGIAPVRDDPRLFHPPGSVTVHALALWDTVASLGLPLWGWWFRVGNLWRNDALDTSPAAVCERIYHAAAMDERRSQFFVTMFDEGLGGFRKAKHDAQIAGDQEQVLEQVWFRGSHGGIGGGYVDCGVSDIALAWMVERLASAGLKVNHAALSSLVGNPLAPLHNQLERQRAWYLFGTWPRWHPCLRRGAASEGFGTLHPSVHRRAAHAAALRETVGPMAPTDPEEMRFLDPPEPGSSPAPARFRVRADWQWCRTGIVLERGVLYEIRRGCNGKWRDAECRPCGPEGDANVTDARAWFPALRRHDAAEWMELVATVAHPRKWPLRELRGRFLFRYLFRRDPEELTCGLMAIGRHLREKTDRVFIYTNAPAGMLHCFANDAWLFYENNSGALDFDIIRHAEAPPPARDEHFKGDLPCFVVDAEPSDVGGVAEAPGAAHLKWLRPDSVPPRLLSAAVS